MLHFQLKGTRNTEHLLRALQEKPARSRPVYLIVSKMNLDTTKSHSYPHQRCPYTDWLKDGTKFSEPMDRSKPFELSNRAFGVQI